MRYAVSWIVDPAPAGGQTTASIFRANDRGATVVPASIYLDPGAVATDLRVYTQAGAAADRVPLVSGGSYSGDVIQLENYGATQIRGVALVDVP